MESGRTAAPRLFFFFQAEDGIRDSSVTGVQTCALPIYLLADLVDEDDDGARARDGGGELAQGLRHEARLESRQRVAHFAVVLGPRHEPSDGVDASAVTPVPPPQPLFYLNPLLAGAGPG